MYWYKKAIDIKDLPADHMNKNCFVVAAQYVLHESRDGNTDLILVHGVVTGQGAIKGLRYIHAWVEDGDTVIDKSNGKNIKMPRFLYYALGNIGKAFKYTPQKVKEGMLKYSHYGPWDFKS